MGTLPQLIEEDIQGLNGVLREFIRSTDATATLIIDKGGFLITHQGQTDDFDLTTIGALASGATGMIHARGAVPMACVILASITASTVALYTLAVPAHVRRAEA